MNNQRPNGNGHDQQNPDLTGSPNNGPANNHPPINGKVKNSVSPSALLTAFQQHQSSLKRFISRYLRSTQDIEDVTQEAYLRAFIASQATDIKQPKSFLFRIAKNVAVSELRLKSRQITDYIDDQAGSDVLLDEGTVEDEVMARQKLGIHCEAVAFLAPQCRKVYLMRKVYGMSHKEIAERLGVAESTVRNHLMKGVELCDRYVRERTGEVGPDARATVNTAAPRQRERREKGQG